MRESLTTDPRIDPIGRIRFSELINELPLREKSGQTEIKSLLITFYFDIMLTNIEDTRLNLLLPKRDI